MTSSKPKPKTRIETIKTTPKPKRHPRFTYLNSKRLLNAMVIAHAHGYSSLSEALRTWYRHGHSATKIAATLKVSGPRILTWLSTINIKRRKRGCTTGARLTKTKIKFLQHYQSRLDLTSTIEALLKTKNLYQISKESLIDYTTLHYWLSKKDSNRHITLD